MPEEDVPEEDVPSPRDSASCRFLAPFPLFVRRPRVGVASIADRVAVFRRRLTWARKRWEARILSWDDWVLGEQIKVD